MTENASLGIFCIENWTGDLRSPSTVRPLLEYLDRLDAPPIRFVHQRISNLDELHTYMDRWAKLSTYQVGYLALHGYPAGVQVGSETMTVNRLLDRTFDGDEERWSLDLTDKVLYIGACSTMGRQQQFDRAFSDTGARVICGYKNSVWAHESAAFELLLFSELAGTSDPVTALRSLDERFPDLIKRLGFRWCGQRARSRFFDE